MKEEKETLTPIGFINKKYMILKQLGSGGEGSVYLVKRISDNKYFAAKLINKTTINTKKKKVEKEKGNEEEKEKGKEEEKEKGKEEEKEEEIKNLIELKQRGFKGMVEFIEYGDCIVTLLGKLPEQKIYIILELATNKDLGDYICFLKEGFEEKYSKILFYKIVKNVKSIHDCNICHRDLKLDNIILNDICDPKICDFGYATKNKKDLKEIKGTPDFLSPEVNGSEYDGKLVDIFNLGMILIGLTTGKYKFYKQDEENEYYNYIKNRDKKSFFNAFDTRSVKLTNNSKIFVSRCSHFCLKKEFLLMKY